MHWNTKDNNLFWVSMTLRMVLAIHPKCSGFPGGIRSIRDVGQPCQRGHWSLEGLFSTMFQLIRKYKVSHGQFWQYCGNGHFPENFLPEASYHILSCNAFRESWRESSHNYSWNFSWYSIQDSLNPFKYSSKDSSRNSFRDFREFFHWSFLDFARDSLGITFKMSPGISLESLRKISSSSFSRDFPRIVFRIFLGISSTISPRTSPLVTPGFPLGVFLAISSQIPPGFVADFSVTVSLIPPEIHSWISSDILSGIAP